MERFGRPRRVFGAAGAAVTLARATAHHQSLQGQKPWKFFANGIDGLAQWPRDAFGKILADEEERLDRAHSAFLIFKHEEMVFEVIGQRSADEFVEAVVLALILEGFAPGWAILELRLGDNRGKALWNPDGVAR